MNTFNLGMGLVKIGAGRVSMEENLDPSSGLHLNIKIGDSIVIGDDIGIIFNSNEKKLEESLILFENCFEVSDDLVSKTDLIIDYS